MKSQVIDGIWFQSLLISVAAVWVVGGCGNPPPNAPRAPVGDSNALTGTIGHYQAYPNDADKGPVGLRFSWDDGDTSDWTAATYRPGSAAVDSHSWDLSGIFHVRAQARDAKERMSPWSDSFEVTVTSGGDEPPVTPAPPLGPDSGLVNVSYLFRASTTDGDNDSLDYRFDWGAGDTSVWLGPVAAGETLSASHTWTAPGQYDVKVQAMDDEGFGVTSDWSQPHLTIIR